MPASIRLAEQAKLAAAGARAISTAAADMLRAQLKTQEEWLREEQRERGRLTEQLARVSGQVAELTSGAQQWRQRLFVSDKDSNDMEYRPHTHSDAPDACDLSSLSSSHFVLWRFGVLLVGALHRLGLTRTPPVANRGAVALPVTLRLAASLPASQHPQTAYRNSFLYDAERNSLWIRRQRLENVGEFVLVLLHCLAHVSTSATSGVWDDRDPAFVGCFHQLLQVCVCPLY